MKYLYKYPQAAYPYEDLIATNRARTRQDFEYELLDTGIFDDDRYFDVFVEYAKADAEDILIQITIANRGPEAAALHVLPTLWFRNIWSWGNGEDRPVLRQTAGGVITASHPKLGDRFLVCEDAGQLLFTENKTNTERVFGKPNPTPFVKDGIDGYVVHGRRDAVNPELTGTKAAAHYEITVEAGEARVLRLRLQDKPSAKPFGAGFEDAMKARRKEADEFYGTVIPHSLSDDEAAVMRQALAGMLWSKQVYFFDVERWLTERGAAPFDPKRRTGSRNERWQHLYNLDVLSMPDKWEYPWYAAWDLAFHVLALTLVDEDFGKQQLDLLLQGPYMHPSGQIPAYEWNFGDVNPPVHAWSTIFTYSLEKIRTGKGDDEWLERMFHKLALNFTWWVNRKDHAGDNAFEGGFLGLDNIGVFDRSAPLPTGGYLEQADGTAWMALFCQNMMQIASQLMVIKPAYADMTFKFIEHFLWISNGLMRASGIGMWDEEDGFFYDILRLPDGRAERLKVRSMVGLLPLCAVTVFDGKAIERFPELTNRLMKFIDARPELRVVIHDPVRRGVNGRRMTAILDETKLRRVLKIMLDENEFLGPHGLRALSHYHADHPYVFHTGGQEYSVSYQPAESNTAMFGGNSNWRGPIWMPVNELIIRALLQYYIYYGDDFTVECPTGSGNSMTLYQVAEELSRRLASIFLRDKDGRRPVYGGIRKFQEDPHWRDYILFHEYFHGDNGAGIGASHQTGWTGSVARSMQLFATSTSEQFLRLGGAAMAVDIDTENIPAAAE